MKSNRESLEQVKRYAKYHEALIALAQDHADIETLEQSALAAQERKKQAFDALEKANAQLAETQGKVAEAETTRKAALDAAVDIRAAAQAEANQIRKDALAET